MIRTLLPAVLVGFALVCHAEPPVKVIFDTDMANDCDDAGALAVLHALADRGEAEILAVTTNRKCPSGVSGGVCDAINTFYGRPDIPIGTDKDGAKFRWNKPSSYTRALFDGFRHDSALDAQLPDAVDIYRKTLADADDHSVVICSVGALSNLEDLLHSKSDASSPLDGIELIQSKVKKTIIMGGHFPRSAKPETNIMLDPPAAVSVVHLWPGEILWQGFEIGNAIHCGAELKNEPADNPVRRAFELRPYLGGKAIDFGKPAHDQAAVLLAVRGAEPEFWRTSEGGKVVVDSEGQTEWRSDSRKRDRFVSINGRAERIAQTIDDLMRTVQD